MQKRRPWSMPEEDARTLLAQIEELESAISRDMRALSQAKSKGTSADLWARIHR